AINFVDQSGNNPYQAALPLFDEKNNVWTCENIVCIKRGVNVGFSATNNFVVTDTLAWDPNRTTSFVWAQDFDTSDFAWRFRWADQYAIGLSTSTAAFRGFPTFRDVQLATYWEDVCIFPSSRTSVAAGG